MNNKNIIAFIFSLFAFLSTNGFANSIDTRPSNNKHHETTDGISQSSHKTDSQNIVGIEGLLQTSIKVNESNAPTFQSFKNSKKSFNLNSSLKSFLFSKSYYACYCSDRINRINVSPFYIAYHRLLI